MAPVLGDGDSGFSMKKKEDTEERENLWTAILAEVQRKGSTKLPSCKQLLVLGDNESGKTTLIAKLQGVEDPKKGSALEYAYIDVRDEYREDHTRLSVWVLDGDPAHSHLLRFALSADTFPHTTVVFVVAMTTPWSLLEQLENWASILQDHIDKLDIPSDQMQEYRLKCIRRWQEYVEMAEDLEIDSQLRRTSRNFDEEGLQSELLPLGEGVLTSNIGLDVVVVVTKTDYMTTLEKEMDYKDEHFDFMQQWIRKFCLQYGAGLFYTSAKEDKNCDLLYKYLSHRIYGFPFRTPALVVEKDAVLIPSGWDNMKKICILYENMQTVKPDEYYRNFIFQPMASKAVAKDSEIQAEDEQGFLAKQLALLQQGGTPVIRTESPMRTPAGVQKTGDRRVQGSPSVQGSPKKMDPSKPGAAGSGEGVLANFFNSLLHKKTGAGSPMPKSPNDLSLTNSLAIDKSVVRSDAAAELDRLARKKPPSSSPSLDQNSSEC